MAMAKKHIFSFSNRPFVSLVENSYPKDRGEKK